MNKILNRFTITILSVFFVFVLAHKAEAATYYVSPSGNDGNPGSESSPWRTIQKAANTLMPGDTVLVRSGVYVEKVVALNSGTVGSRITYKNYPGENPVIDGSGVSLGTYEGLVTVAKDYLTFDGFEIRNSSRTGISDNRVGVLGLWLLNLNVHNVGRTGIDIGDNKHSLTANIRHNTIIKGNNVSDTGVGGIVVWECAFGGYYLIEDNEVSNNQGTGNYDAIEVGGGDTGCGAHHTVARFNVLHNNNLSPEGLSDGIDFGGRNANSGYFVVEYNTMYGKNNATKFSGLGTTNGIMRYNSMTTEGSLVFYSPPYKKTTIYNNTLVDEFHDILFLDACCNVDWQGIEFINNLFVNNRGPALNAYGSINLGNVKMVGNMWKFINPYFYWGSNQYSGLAAFKAAGQEGKGKETTASLSQIFVDAGSRNYNLASGSPAVDAGNALTTTRSSGSGTLLPVVNSAYFHDTYEGFIEADTIKVGNNQPVKIASIDYNSNNITLTQAISWNMGDSVNLPYGGSAPDMGAFESGFANPTPPPLPPTPTPSPTPSPTGIKGDINRDGIVNSLDWSMMNNKWFMNDANADLNDDGIVNSLDFSLLNSNWLKTS